MREESYSFIWQPWVAMYSFLVKGVARAVWRPVSRVTSEIGVGQKPMRIIQTKRQKGMLSLEHAKKRPSLARLGRRRPVAARFQGEHTRSQILVDPGEEKLKKEFSGVQRSYIPMQAIIRIDEVDREGSVRVSELAPVEGNVASFPLPARIPASKATRSSPLGQPRPPLRPPLRTPLFRSFALLFCCAVTASSSGQPHACR